MTELTVTAPLAYDLRAGGRIDPLGVADPSPLLTWRVAGSVPPEGFLVQAASSQQALVAGRSDRFEVSLAAGAAQRLAWPAARLSSREQIWWRVGTPLAGAVAWSDPATIEAALWEQGEWEAAAITHPAWLAPSNSTALALPELTQVLQVDRQTVRARLYLTAAGVVVPTLNGRPAIRGQLEPGYSQFSESVPASAWDVTDLIHRGENRLTLAVGGGITYLPALGDRYSKFTRTDSPLWARARLEVEDDQGRVSVLTTDETWSVRESATTVAHWFGGESFGGQPGPWGPVALVPDAVPSWWRSSPPIVVTEVLPCVASTRHGEVRTLDFGLNAAGRPRITTADLPAGAALRLAPAEILDAEGRIDQSTTGSPIWDSWTSATPSGAAAVTSSWAPSFVYHGARYLEVSGLNDIDSDSLISFEVMRADNERVGQFSSSAPFLNDLHRIIDRAVQSNMFSVFTDCPHREKLGWIEQLHLVFNTLARNYDVQAHLSDAVRHMIEAQTPTGLVPSIAPELVVFTIDEFKGDISAFRDDPNWGRAIIEIPWNLYRHYGDAAILTRALPAIEAYLGHLESRASEGILDFGLGDWVEIDSSTPRALVATHAWAQSLQSAARCAHAVGDLDRAALWQGKADQVRSTVRTTFRDPATGVWGSGSQCSWALASCCAGLSETERARIADELVRQIRQDGGSVTVGEIGLPPLIRALTDSGNADLLHQMIRRTDAPGYGHQLAAGATALTESWHGPSGDAGVASQNHFMLGAIDGWILEDVVGLRQSEGSVGWSSVVVSPQLLTGVNDVQSTFEAPTGRFEVEWHREGDGAVLTIIAPPGVEVTTPESDGLTVHLTRA